MTQNVPKVPIDEKWLREQYIEDEKSTWEIASELDVPQWWVIRRLHKHQIPTRNLSDAAKIRFRREGNPNRYITIDDEYRRKLSEAHKGVSLSSKHRSAIGDSVRGFNHWNWQGGKSFDPYCPLFDNELKNEIRNRDNRVCVLCGKPEILNGRRLDVHHIDGDKMQGCSSRQWYLASLCRSCNTSKDTIEKEFLLVSNLGG